MHTAEEVTFVLHSESARGGCWNVALNTLLQEKMAHVIVVRWRRVVYVACASGNGSIDHEGGARVGL